MFRIKVNPPAGKLERMGTAGISEFIGRITDRVNVLMFRLQAKIVGETIPRMFPAGAPNIAAGIRAIPATQEGTKVRGYVEGGGPKTTKLTLGGPNAGQAVDYAAVQELGVDHAWKIQPVLYSSAYASIGKSPTTNLKARVHSIQGLPKALAFILGGKQVIVRSVLHPGLRERPFMRQGLKEMEAQIVSELEKEITDALS